MSLIEEQMVAILADVQAVGKDRKNLKQGYSFRGIDDFVNMLHPLLAKHRVILRPRVVEAVALESVETQRGGVLFRHQVTMELGFVATDGSTLTVRTVGEGADSGDKALNKATSGALKYALLMTFLVPTRGELLDSEEDSHDARPRRKARRNDPHEEWRHHLANRACALGKLPKASDEERRIRMLDHMGELTEAQLRAASGLLDAWEREARSGPLGGDDEFEQATTPEATQQAHADDLAANKARIEERLRSGLVPRVGPTDGAHLDELDPGKRPAAARKRRGLPLDPPDPTEAPPQGAP